LHISNAENINTTIKDHEFDIMIAGGIIVSNSVLKLLYLGIQNASKKWTMPIQNWNLTFFFEGRLDDALDL